MTVAIQNTVREKNSGAAQKNRVVVVGEECARVSAKYTQNQMTQICCSLFCFFFFLQFVRSLLHGFSS